MLADFFLDTLVSSQTMNRDGMLASENKTLALTQRPVTAMLDWWDRNFVHHH